MEKQRENPLFSNPLKNYVLLSLTSYFLSPVNLLNTEYQYYTKRYIQMEQYQKNVLTLETPKGFHI